MNVQAGAIPWRACHLAGMTALCFSLLLAVACPARGAEIHRAVALGEGEKVRQLIEHDRSLISAPDIDGSTPLHVAAERGRKEIAAFLLSSGAVADARNREKQTPLHVAARWGHRSVLNLLLNAQCDVKAEDIYGYTPVSWVCTQGDVELVALLLGKGHPFQMERCVSQAVRAICPSCNCSLCEVLT